jgi:hypothetical protein
MNGLERVWTRAHLWAKAALLVIPILVLASVALAQSGGGYDLTWNTIDGGGQTSSGGEYTLSGTIGQPDADLQTGGEYSLGGGFWAGGAKVIPVAYRVYLPLVVRGYE